MDYQPWPCLSRVSYYEIYFSVLRQVHCYPSWYPVLFYFLLLRNIKLRYIDEVYVSKKFQSPTRVPNFLFICLSQFGSCYSKSKCRKGTQQERQDQWQMLHFHKPDFIQINNKLNQLWFSQLEVCICRKQNKKKDKNYSWTPGPPSFSWSLSGFSFSESILPLPVLQGRKLNNM